jgi:hypothetical protein
MFTPNEKARIRHHMGYLNVSEVSTFALGIPAAVETQYLIEGAMNKVLPDAEPIVRGIIAKLDLIDAQMVDDTELLSVRKVDEIELNPEEMQLLRKEYRFRQRELGNLLGIEPNPYDQRFRSSVNVAVRN